MPPFDRGRPAEMAHVDFQEKLPICIQTPALNRAKLFKTLFLMLFSWPSLGKQDDGCSSRQCTKTFSLFFVPCLRLLTLFPFLSPILFFPRPVVCGKGILSFRFVFFLSSFDFRCSSRLCPIFCSSLIGVTSIENTLRFCPSASYPHHAY